jgi:WD40 repeat protein
MNTYTLLTTALNFFMIFTIVCMENDEMITFLGQRPVMLENSKNWHSIVGINDDTDEVTARILFSDTIETWNMNTGKLTHAEKAPKNYSVPFEPFTIIYGNNIVTCNDGLITVRDINTNKCLLTFQENHPHRIVMNDDKIVTGLCNGDINIRTINDGKLLHTLQTGTIFALALYKNILISSACTETLCKWDVNDGTLLKKLDNKSGEYDSAEVQAIAMNDTMIVTKSFDTLKIWNKDTGDLIQTIKGSFYSGYNNIPPMLAIGKKYVVVADRDSIKASHLSADLAGTPENNPLLWIQQKANSAQFDLIKRAYEATIAQKQLLIALPQDPGIIRLNESQEQKDGRLYPTLALAVRNYLRTRLNITVY